MRTNQIRTAFLGLLLAAAAPATCADAGPASWLTIDPPGSGQTMPLAITGNSLIAGWYADNVTHTKHGFVRNRDGTFTSFDAPDATADTVAYGVNTEGVVTGNYTTLIGGLQYAEGYLRAPNGAIIEFQVPGQRYVTPQAINRRGEIVGMAQSDSGPSISFLRTPTGTIKTFTAGYGSGATAINTAGLITGYWLSDKQYGYVRDKAGNMSSFDPPGSMGALPTAINTAGEITGYYYDTNLIYHGFLREPDETFTTFDAPGASSVIMTAGTTPKGIDSNGDIAGCFVNDSYQTLGFVRDRAGNFHTVTAPDGSSTCITAMAPTGKIIGYANNHGFRAFPGLWKKD